MLSKKTIVAICVCTICIVGIIFLWRNSNIIQHNTVSGIIVKEKYVKQAFEPKKNKPQLPKGAAVCGLTLYDIVVKYYITDTNNNAYELTINDYNRVKEGDKIQVTVSKNNVIMQVKIL